MRRFRVLIAKLLLFSLMTSVLHAFFLNHHHDDGTCETVQAFVMEMEHGSDCGDLCEMHHMFHFSAIPTAAVVAVAFCGRIAPETRIHDFTPLYNPKPSFRPPITLS